MTDRGCLPYILDRQGYCISWSWGIHLFLPGWGQIQGKSWIRIWIMNNMDPQHDFNVSTMLQMLRTVEDDSKNNFSILYFRPSRDISHHPGLCRSPLCRRTIRHLNQFFLVFKIYFLLKLCKLLRWKHFIQLFLFCHTCFKIKQFHFFLYKYRFFEQF